MTPATAVPLSFAFSVPSLLKVYVCAWFHFSKRERLLGSVLLLGIIRYVMSTFLRVKYEYIGDG